MRFSILPIGIVAAICIVVMTGCATRSQPPREIITFDYTPEKEAPSGSAKVTFAIVGTQLGAPTQQGVTQLPAQAPVPLFEDFASSMTKDFMEVLSAHGFGVRGPFKTYDKMIHPDKEGSDLILSAVVEFGPDTSQLKLREVIYPAHQHRIVGPVTVKCHVDLIVHESLTNERMWTKSIAIQPLTVQLVSHHTYSLQDLMELSMKYGKVFQRHTGVPIEVLLEHENKFYSELGHAIKGQYNEILNKIYDYLDPREMAIVKKQAVELRKKKVY